MTFTSIIATLVAALVVYNAIDALPQERSTFRTGTRLVEISVNSFDNTFDISVSNEGLAQVTRDGVTLVATVGILPEAERLRIVVRDVRTGNLGAIGIPTKQVRTIVP